MIINKSFKPVLKFLFFYVFLVQPTVTFAQKASCFCDRVPAMNTATVSCDTTVLFSGSKLYWQFNCSRIWYTLENRQGKRKVLNEVPAELYPLTYRLGYHYLAEFPGSILFRAGCPANGPCSFILLDEATGRIIKEYPQLICIENLADPEEKYTYNFVVYLDSTNKKIIVDYPAIAKKIEADGPLLSDELVPESRFDKMELKDGTLNLYYHTEDHKLRIIKIDLD